MLEQRPYRLSAVNSFHVALGAVWDEQSSWRMPQSYGNPEREAASAIAGIGLQDVSDRRKFDVKGSGVEKQLNTSAVNALILNVKPGHALVILDEDSTDLNWLISGLSCWHSTDMTSALSAFVIVGQHAADLLGRVTAVDLRSGRFPVKSCVQCSLAGVHATVYRDVCGPVPMYLILLGRDVAEYVWTQLSDTGAQFGLVPFGKKAAEIIRRFQHGL